MRTSTCKYSPCRVQKKALYSPELESWTSMGHLIWLELELKSSAGSVHAPNHCTISPGIYTEF